MRRVILVIGRMLPLGQESDGMLLLNVLHRLMKKLGTGFLDPAIVAVHSLRSRGRAIPLFIRTVAFRST